MPPKHNEPARGALAGIKADAERAKQAVLEAGKDYTPAIAGVGAAWSHNFLNQKPWHPLNYRNQMRVWEAQQQHDKDEKSRAVAKAEFDAEQEYIKTLSYLSAEEQQRQRERAGVSFMYQKPPGYDAAMAKTAEAGAQQGGEAAPGQAAAGPGPGPSSEAAAAAQQQQQQQGGRRARPDLPQNYVANMLGAINALQQHEKYTVKYVSGTGQRSPPRGGVDPSGQNQQLLVAGDNEEDLEAGVGPSGHAAGAGEDEEDTKQARKRRKLAQAEAYLKAAGLDPAMLTALDSGKDAKKKKKKKHKKEKEKKDEG